MEYVDMYMSHWPDPDAFDLAVEAYRTTEALTDSFPSDIENQ